MKFTVPQQEMVEAFGEDTAKRAYIQHTEHGKSVMDIARSLKIPGYAARTIINAGRKMIENGQNTLKI